MPDKNLTDVEIVKALENCLKNECDKCSFKDSEICQIDLMKLLFDLINRQNAEVERLTIRLRKVEHQLDDLCKMHNVIKAEARKEFAEKAKEIIDLIVDLMFDDSISKCQLPHCHKPSSIPCENETCIQENKEYWHGKLDNLLIEMESEKDA